MIENLVIVTLIQDVLQNQGTGLEARQIEIKNASLYSLTMDYTIISLDGNHKGSFKKNTFNKQ